MGKFVCIILSVHMNTFGYGLVLDRGLLVGAARLLRLADDAGQLGRKQPPRPSLCLASLRHLWCGKHRSNTHVHGQ